MPTKKATSKVSKVKKISSKIKKTAAATKTRLKKAPAKKVVPKKTPVKKTKSKTTAVKKVRKRSGRVLVCADGRSCFWTTDGQILQDLVELSSALEDMRDEVFSHHVTRDRNDFADWVESVLEDAECAAALRKSKKTNTARTVVVRHLKQYNI